MRKKKRSQTGPGGDNPGYDKNPSDERGQHLSSNVCGFCAVLSNCRRHARQSRLVKRTTPQLLFGVRKIRRPAFASRHGFVDSFGCLLAVINEPSMKSKRGTIMGYNYDDPSLKTGADGLTVWTLHDMAQEKQFKELNDLFNNGLTMNSLPVGYAAGAAARVLDIDNKVIAEALDSLAGKNWRGRYSFRRIIREFPKAETESKLLCCFQTLRSSKAGESHRRAVLGLFVFNAGVTILFAWVGAVATVHGFLLWPAVILHAVIAAALLPQLLTTRAAMGV